MGRIKRKPYEVGNDVGVKAQVARYRELREWKQGAEQEMHELQEKLGVVMSEHDAMELTVGGVPVARRTMYDMLTVSAKDLLRLHPRIGKKMVKTTPVDKIEIV